MDRIIQIPEEDIVVCKEFAKKRLEGSANMYKRRNNASLEKIELDIFTGAMGELGIYYMLTELGYTPDKPDFNIYAAKQKSYDADMRMGEYNIHCKTQHYSSANKYGDSIILQYGRYGQDKLFKHRTDKDLLAWATLIDDNHVKIQGIMSIPWIFDNGLVKPPKLKWLEDCKRALYLVDFKGLDLWQLPVV